MSDQTEHEGVTVDAESEAAAEPRTVDLGDRAGEQTRVDEPTADEPTADEPTADETRTDETPAEEPRADGAAAVEDGARSRRPSSLRLPTDLTGRLPHRKVLPSSFPSSPAFPGSPVQPPVSEPEESGRSGQVPNFVSSLRAKLPAGKLPTAKLPTGKLPTPKLPTGKLPTDKLPTDKLPVDRARTLFKERPEVGVGIAFVGGLVIATIIKRLGRR